MRFKETYYSITDNSIISIVPENINLKQWFDAGIKQICIVLDSHNNGQLIHFSGTSWNYERKVNKSFNEIIDKINNFTEENLTILVSLYNHVNGDEILKIINIENLKGQLFYCLIKTNGYLIYHHQLKWFLVNEMRFSEQ